MINREWGMEMNSMRKIESFRDIEAHQIGCKLKNNIYKLTQKLPKEEKFNLINQMKRCAVSITSCIAEGYGRYHYLERIRFCYISRGSAFELQDHLSSCLDFNYINKEEYELNYKLSLSFIKSLNGYIRFLRKQHSSKPTV